MKRSLTLTLLLALIATFSFAQIRIEKRHYNSGWYIALGKDKKEKREARVTEKKTNVVAKPVEETTSAFTSNESIAQNEVVVESVASKHVVAEKKSTTKKIKTQIVQAIQPVAQPVKHVVVGKLHDVKNQGSFSRTAKADPGDSFGAYVFGHGSMGDFLLMLLLVIALMYLLMYLFPAGITLAFLI